MANVFHSAVSMFTVLPVPAVSEMDRRDCMRTIRQLPFVGLLVGVLAGSVAALLWFATHSPFLAAAGAVAIWVLTTGGFHQDGLADTMDALASRRPATEALEIMKRHDIGPMGVAAIVVVLLVNVISLASLGESWTVLLAASVAAPIAGRCGALEGCGTWNKPARSYGLGHILIGDITRASWITVTGISGLLVVAAGCLAGGLGNGGWGISGWGNSAWLMGAAFAISFLGAQAVDWSWRRFLARRFSGMTGDMLGCLVEYGTLAFLVLAAVSTGVVAQVVAP